MGGAGVRDGPIGRWSGALQRRKRIAKLFNYFQSWKIQRLQEMAKPAGERMLPAFNPPKPDLATGLLQSFEVESELFSKESFKQAIHDTFVKAGQAAKQAYGSFIQYRSHERASIASFLLKEGKPEEASLATLTGPAVDVITYDEDEEPDTDVDENIDED